MNDSDATSNEHMSCSCFLLQTPKARAEIKELELDLSKDRGSSNYFIKLYLLPISVQIGEPHVVTSTHSPDMNSDILLAKQTSEGSSSPSIHCEKVSFSCEFGHNRYFSTYFLHLAQVITPDLLWLQIHYHLMPYSEQHVICIFLIFMVAIL